MTTGIGKLNAQHFLWSKRPSSAAHSNVISAYEGNKKCGESLEIPYTLSLKRHSLQSAITTYCWKRQFFDRFVY
jgi:hypothetical protein